MQTNQSAVYLVVAVLDYVEDLYHPYDNDSGEDG